MSVRVAVVGYGHLGKHHPPLLPDIRDADRLTIPDVMRLVVAQSGGLMAVESLAPGGCENALCSFHGNFVLMPNGRLVPWSKNEPQSCGCQPASAAAVCGCAK